MRKYFCDSCEKEFKDINVFNVPCHTFSLRYKSGYSDSEGNQVSGRMDRIDLCNKCLNVAYFAAINAIGLDKPPERDC